MGRWIAGIGNVLGKLKNKTRFDVFIFLVDMTGSLKD
jgi:hypothetical protein